MYNGRQMLSKYDFLLKNLGKKLFIWIVSPYLLDRMFIISTDKWKCLPWGQAIWKLLPDLVSVCRQCPRTAGLSHGPFQTDIHFTWKKRVFLACTFYIGIVYRIVCSEITRLRVLRNRFYPVLWNRCPPQDVTLF